MYDFPLLIVDLLRLLVAEQQDDGSEKEDGRAPADAIGPAELPDSPIGWNMKYI